MKSLATILSVIVVAASTSTLCAQVAGGSLQGTGSAGNAGGAAAGGNAGAQGGGSPGLGANPGFQNRGTNPMQQAGDQIFRGANPTNIGQQAPGQLGNASPPQFGELGIDPGFLDPANRGAMQTQFQNAADLLSRGTNLVDALREVGGGQLFEQLGLSQDFFDPANRPVVQAQLQRAAEQLAGGAEPIDVLRGFTDGAAFGQPGDPQGLSIDPRFRGFGGGFAVGGSGGDSGYGGGVAQNSFARPGMGAGEAALLHQEAHSRAIDNHEKHVKARAELQRFNKHYRNSDEPAALSMSDASRLAKQNAPRRLSSSEVDPVTGRIAWPVMLRDAQYGNYIEQLEELYAMRAAQGGDLDAEMHRQITGLCRAFQDTLRAKVDEYSPSEFASAYRFVESLGREIQLDTTQIAAIEEAPTSAVALGR